MMTFFLLHSTLEQQSIFMGSLNLCQLRLINDQRFPWFLLIPQIPNIKEIFDLSECQQRLLFEETSAIAQKIHQHFKADKMNIATLGNSVPQLHMHIIARFKNDLAWPNAVWGIGGASIPYSLEQQKFIRQVMIHKENS